MKRWHKINTVKLQESVKILLHTKDNKVSYPAISISLLQTTLKCAKQVKVQLSTKCGASGYRHETRTEGKIEATLGSLFSINSPLNKIPRQEILSFNYYKINCVRQKSVSWLQMEGILTGTCQNISAVLFSRPEVTKKL